MMESVVTDLIPWRVRNWLTKRKAHGIVRMIAREAQPYASDVSMAIGKTISRSFSEMETALLSKINDLRASCLNSTQQITFIDYGAGDPSSPRSLEEAREGVEQKIDLSRLAMHTSKAEPWSHLLFNLVRQLRPQRCLELGTCIGFSASYQCAAMKMNGTGSLLTLEGAPTFAAIAKDHLTRLGADNFDIIVGKFEDTLDDAIAKYGPFDFMFNDGHHDGEAMLAYFDKCLPSFSNDAVLLFDDINNYPSMRAAWQELLHHERVALAVDFGPMGLVGLGRKSCGRPSVFCIAL